MSIVLVVAPHPDDETLGCGGTLLRHHDKGDETHWLIVTSISEDVGYSKNEIDRRKTEINDVAESYGFKSVTQAGFNTTMLDKVSKKELISLVSDVFNQIKPDTIYMPYRNDIHTDHGEVFDAVASCTKSFRFPFIRKVRVYETLSETEFSMRTDDKGFRPNLWIDITLYLDKKIEIMKLYKNEIKNHPFPRSEQNIRALATLRGSTINVNFAESFITLKESIQ